MDWKTDLNLLDSLRDTGASNAWEVFYDRYKDALFRYARKLGLSETDSQEVVQETMIAMIRILPEFVYDRNRKFRNLLLTIAHRKVLNILKLRYRKNLKLSELLNEQEVSSDIVHSDSVHEKEDLQRWRQALMESVLADLRNQSGINKKSYDIFECHILHEQSAEHVAAKFGVTTNSVYQIKFRIQKRLKSLAQRLESDLL